VEFAVDGAKRMQDLINDLLEFSRIGSRGRPFQPTDMNEVVAEAMQFIKGFLTKDGLTQMAK